MKCFVVVTERLLHIWWVDGNYNEDTAESEDIEMKVKSSYANICGENNGILNGHSSNNFDESYNEDLESYKGFAREFSIANITIIEPV